MDNTLCHHGIKGQKWGIRRYQNKDGSLTPAGRKKLAKLDKQYEKVTGGKKAGDSNFPTATKPKTIGEMTNQELQSKIDRARLEKTYAELYPVRVSAGKKLVNSFKDKAISTMMDKGTKVAGDYVEKKFKEKLGLNEIDPASKLRKEAEMAGYRRKIAEAKAYVDSQKIKTTPTKNLIGDISDLTDQQLKDVINRINDENNLIRKLSDRR